MLELRAEEPELWGPKVEGGLTKIENGSMDFPKANADGDVSIIGEKPLVEAERQGPQHPASHMRKFHFFLHLPAVHLPQMTTESGVFGYKQ